ncbi:MAG TPA: hypothetical protein VKY90_14605 [Candidatus Dormibacteraeota bacterium]|nr:hypothetical protein [Candidatus Dormibacteraeota bacterium]
MVDDGASIRVRTRHAELTLEEIASLLPGTGEVMASVARSFGSAWHAAGGGNWGLAAYFVRRVRGQLRALAVVRPKYREAIEAFQEQALAPLLDAIARQDRAAFELAYDAAVELADRYHAETGHPYIRWRRPPQPPETFV